MRHLCELQQTAQRAIMTLTQRSLCLAFRSWHAAAISKREKQAAAVRALSAMRSSGLRRAFNAWQECGAWLRDSGTTLNACLRVAHALVWRPRVASRVGPCLQLLVSLLAIMSPRLMSIITLVRTSSVQMNSPS